MDLGSFTRRGLLVDRMHPADTWEREGTKHGEGRGCKTRNEAEEDRDPRAISDGEVIGP